MNAHAVLGHTSAATDAYGATLMQWAFRRDFMSDRQAQLYDYWSAEGGADGGLSITAFDPLAVWGCIGFLHILEYDKGRGDFFYRVYGESAAGAARAAMHRRWVSEQPGNAGAAFHAHYSDVMASRRPWLGEVFTVDRLDVAPYWYRIVLPLAVPGNPKGFACVTLAEPVDTLPNRATLSHPSFSGLDADALDLAG